ncbi:MAG: hypothetical protein ABI634_10345 [Acidobacteriota bacterium]
MRRVFAASVMVMAALWAGPATAQNAPASSVPSGPLVNSWYVGLNTGAAVVEKFGGVVAVEGGMRFRRNLDIIGEIGWAQNSVSARQLDKISTLARSLASSQGATASGTLKAPVTFSGIGARWVLENSGRFRPYFLVTVGGAKVNLKPTLTLNGANITSTADQYGVTLGQDVIGKANHFASEGGIGVVSGIGTSWYVDLGARLLSINADQRVNVARIVIGGGYRF